MSISTHLVHQLEQTFVWTFQMLSSPWFLSVIQTIHLIHISWSINKLLNQYVFRKTFSFVLLGLIRDDILNQRKITSSEPYQNNLFGFKFLVLSPKGARLYVVLTYIPWYLRTGGTQLGYWCEITKAIKVYFYLFCL